MKIFENPNILLFIFLFLVVSCCLSLNFNNLHFSKNFSPLLFSLGFVKKIWPGFWNRYQNLENSGT